MNDYEPVELTSFCNAGADFFGEPVPTGQQCWQGLPFQVGGGGGHCLVAFGPGHRTSSLRVPVGRSARHVVFAQRLAESSIRDGAPTGDTVATYRFHLKGGEVVPAPQRERFEICTVPSDGGRPFVAFPDQKDELLPRWEGRWDAAGRRQTETAAASNMHFALYVWSNPHPEQELEAIEVEPGDRVFAVAAVTLGHADEFPICREGLRDVRITLTDPEAADRPFDLEVEVDRGVTTYPYPLSRKTPEEFVEDRKGWGEAQNQASSPAGLQIAASPSATVKVRQDGEPVGETRWGDVVEAGSAESADGRVRVEMIDHGRNWVRTRVLDGKTGRPVPCRIHFRSPEGVAYAPHGHHGHVNSDMDSWHIDVGGDVRMGQLSYAYTDGTCQGWLPRGRVIVDVARGFEYEPLRREVEIRPGQTELDLTLDRWVDMNGEGWYSGDSHVHFLSAQGSHMEANGEDLDVVNMLQSQWGSLFTDTQEFTGGVSSDGESLVYVSQENRQHFLGHLILWGLKEPVMPWCSDGPGEAEIGGTLEVTMSDWADQCRGQGGTVVIPHLPNPNGEPATLIATGRADAVEMLRHGPFEHQEYYRYLNCGYRLPLVGGTDKMSNEVPVGLYRTYVRIPEDEPFTYDSWCANVARGRTFHSGGPILRLKVDGCDIGDTLRLPGNGGTVEVEAQAESVVPIHTLQIVQEGRVVASADDAGGTRALRVEAKVEVKGNSWIAARCAGPGYTGVAHHDGWGRSIMAHTSPVYLTSGDGEWWMFDESTAQYMLTLVDGCLQYIRGQSRQHTPGTATHHHGGGDHMAYLESPFLEAREAIHRRLHQHRIPH